jgi:hypothetical protein
MHEFILANLLFHVGAGTALMLIASSTAIRELHLRRASYIQGSTVHDTHTVIDLPSAPRAPKLLPRVSLETHSEAA